MTADEAMAALQTFNPDFPIKVTKDQNGAPYAIQVYYRDPVSYTEDSIIISLSVPPKPPVVLFIERTYRSPTPISVAQVLDELRSKYGKESVSAMRETWYFNERQQLVPPPKVAPPGCLIFNASEHYWSTSLSVEQFRQRASANSRMPRPDPTEKILAYGGIKPECGTLLEVSGAPAQGLTTSFIMRLIDHPAYAQAVVAGYRYQVEQENASQKQELEKAKQRGGPRL